MQRGRTAGRIPVLPKTFEELFEHPNATYREIARVLQRHQPATVNRIADNTTLTMGTVQKVVTQLKRAKLIHVAQWEHPSTHSWLAAYATGDGENAVKNLADKRVRKKAPEPEARWDDLMQALVPQRTPEQVAEVNRLYLNWISEGMYG